MERMLYEKEILFLNKNYVKSILNFTMYLLLSNACIIY